MMDNAPITWAILKQRQRNERVHLLVTERDAGYSQKEAAINLGMTLTALNNVVRREGIAWATRQGQPARKVITWGNPDH